MEINDFKNILPGIYYETPFFISVSYLILINK